MIKSKEHKAKKDVKHEKYILGSKKRQKQQKTYFSDTASQKMSPICNNGIKSVF